MVCQRLNLHQPNARQMASMLCYHSSPNSLLLALQKIVSTGSLSSSSDHCGLQSLKKSIRRKKNGGDSMDQARGSEETSQNDIFQKKFLWAWTTLVKGQEQSLSHICGSKITLLILDYVFSSVNEFQRSSEERTVWVCGSCQEPKPPSGVLFYCPQAQGKAQWNFPVGQGLRPESRKGPS